MADTPSPESNAAPDAWTPGAANADLSGRASQKGETLIGADDNGDKFPTSAFLRAYYEGRAFVLHRKHPETGKWSAGGFVDADQAAERSARFDGVENQYFTVNETPPGFGKKPKDTDIVAARWAQVDIDARPLNPSDMEGLGDERLRAHYAAERNRIRALLTDLALAKQGIPPATLIIFSGGGWQAFWKFAAPLGPEFFDRVRAVNKTLAHLLEGDATHDISRVMRLPGTQNLPDAKKRAKGREAALARVDFFDPTRVHSIDDFPQATVSAPKGKQGGKRKAASASSAVRSLDDLSPRLQRIAREGCIPEEPKKDNSRSHWLMDFIMNAIRNGASDEAILGWTTDPALKISESVLERSDGRKYVERKTEEAREIIDAEPPSLHKDDPVRSAKAFVARQRPALMHYNDDWLAHDGAAYAELERATVRSELYDFLNKAVVRVMTDNGVREMPFCPTARKVSDAEDALKARTHVPRDIYAPPCWLPGGGGPAPGELLSCRNGLLHLPTGELLPATDRFFTRNALDFDYDPNATAPQWLEFLNQLGFEEDEARLKQETCGYLITPDTSLQKIFLWYGVPRSGKGTAARVLGRLVGRENRCSPTLDSLSRGFGLEPLIGKQLAVVSDMRLGAKTDKAAMAENLLRISGEDTVTSDRKYKQAWTGRLGARFLIMSNEMPSWPESSGALANRFVPLRFGVSFLGREDPTTEQRLAAELPGILNWAIAGWRRLRERGHFVLPPKSREIVEQMEGLNSPLKVFLAHVLENGFVMDPNGKVAKDHLYRVYLEWNAQRRGRDMDMALFSSKLMQASGERISAGKLPPSEGRTPVFQGIRELKPGEGEGAPVF